MGLSQITKTVFGDSSIFVYKNFWNTKKIINPLQVRVITSTIIMLDK